MGSTSNYGWPTMAGSDLANTIDDTNAVQMQDIDTKVKSVEDTANTAATNASSAVTTANAASATASSASTAAGAAQTTANAAVPNSLFDANTILKADSDNTPLALTVAASRFVGRKSTGAIAAMTPAEAKTELAIATTDVSGFAEAVDDEVNALLVAGTNITLSYDDPGNHLTINSVAAASWTVVSKTANYTANANEMVLCDTTGGAFTVTVPTGSGQQAAVFLTAGTPVLTIARGSGNNSSLNQVGDALITVGTGTVARSIGDRHQYGSADYLNENVYTADQILSLADAGVMVSADKASAITLTIPQYSSVNWVQGTSIPLYNKGVGQATIAAGAGVTLRAPNGAKLSKQYSVATLWNRALNEWVLFGDTTT